MAELKDSGVEGYGRRMEGKEARKANKRPSLVVGYWLLEGLLPSFFSWLATLKVEACKASKLGSMVSASCGRSNSLHVLTLQLLFEKQD